MPDITLASSTDASARTAGPPVSAAFLVVVGGLIIAARGWRASNPA